MGLTQEQLEQLTNRSPDIVIATDRKGRVIYYNDGAHDTLGYDAEEVLGEFVGLFYPTVDEARRVGEAMREPRARRPGVVQHPRDDLRRPFGRAHPRRDLRHDPLRRRGARETARSGTRRTSARSVRKDQLATLGEVAIGLSHEINNPLAVIVNQATLLENDIARLAGECDCSVENERLDAIRREVARISEIVERLGEMVATETLRDDPLRRPRAHGRPAQPRAPRRESDPRLRRSANPRRRRRSRHRPNARGDARDRTAARSRSAHDGEQALAMLAAKPFDLVLSDVVMPKMDGYELYLQVRKSYPNIARPDDDRLPLRQGPHHQAQPHGRASRA